MGARRESVAGWDGTHQLNVKPILYRMQAETSVAHVDLQREGLRVGARGRLLHERHVYHCMEK
jgi:hypothetical protein